jgi:molybdate transport system substrate-binding protein
VAIAPVQSHSPVVYPVAVIQNSKNVAQARSFTGFLLSREANNIYIKYGFNKLSIK